MACFVRGCKSHSSRKQNDSEFISFHRMPQTNKENWIKIIPRAKKHWTKTSRICSKHFPKYCFINEGKWRRLKPNAVPTLNIEPEEDEWMDTLTLSIGSEKFKCENSVLSECHTTILHTLQEPEQKVNEIVVPSRSSNYCQHKIRMHQLEQKLAKAQKLLRKRFLKIHSLQQGMRRLRKKNIILYNRLLEILKIEK